MWTEINRRSEEKFIGRKIMKDKFGRVIVNRDQCIYCDRFRWCRYKLWSGIPSDCPELSKIEQTLKNVRDKS